jgi:hypothetical protein
LSVDEMVNKGMSISNSGFWITSKRGEFRAPDSKTQAIA